MGLRIQEIKFAKSLDEVLADEDSKEFEQAMQPYLDMNYRFDAHMQETLLSHELRRQLKSITEYDSEGIVAEGIQDGDVE